MTKSMREWSLELQMGDSLRFRLQGEGLQDMMAAFSQLQGLVESRVPLMIKVLRGKISSLDQEPEQ